jgi:hypothetical protein
LEDGVDELNVKQRVLDFSVAYELHHVEDVSCSVVFHGCFPMSERVHVYAY